MSLLFVLVIFLFYQTIGSEAKHGIRQEKEKQNRLVSSESLYFSSASTAITETEEIRAFSRTLEHWLNLNSFKRNSFATTSVECVALECATLCFFSSLTFSFSFFPFFSSHFYFGFFSLCVLSVGPCWFLFHEVCSLAWTFMVLQMLRERERNSTIELKKWPRAWDNLLIALERNIAFILSHFSMFTRLCPLHIYIIVYCTLL